MSRDRRALEDALRRAIEALGVVLAELVTVESLGFESGRTADDAAVGRGGGGDLGSVGDPRARLLWGRLRAWVPLLDSEAGRYRAAVELLCRPAGRPDARRRARLGAEELAGAVRAQERRRQRGETSFPRLNP